MSTISILMPVRNTERYLSDCLDSIRKQSFQDWELLAVDDHSRDKSFEILRTYSKVDHRIRPQTNKGQGIIHALRTAYDKSTGTYLTRMDSDDLMTTHKLEQFHNKLSASGRGHLTTGLVEYFTDEPKGLGQGYATYAQWLNGLTLANNNYADIYKECSIASPNWMIHREDLALCKAFDSDSYPEDYDLCFRFRQAGLQLANVTELTHYWRDYPDRTSRTDKNYADNKFTALKVRYFLSDDHDLALPLFLWGAGHKGKAVAKELIKSKVSFNWVCNNPNKVGHDIYGVVLQSMESLNKAGTSQVIFAISQKGASPVMDTKHGHHVFSFC